MEHFADLVEQYSNIKEVTSLEDDLCISKRHLCLPEFWRSDGAEGDNRQIHLY